MDKRLNMPGTLAQVTLKTTWLGQQCRNVFYMLNATTPPDWIVWDSDSATEAALALGTAYLANYGPLTSNKVSFDACTWVLSDSVGVGPLLEGDGTPGSFPDVGGESAESTQSSSSLAIKLSTGFGGRDGHGRFFFVGLNAGLYDAVAPNSLKSGSRADFDAAGVAFLGAINGSVLTGGQVCRLAVASFVLDGSDRSPATFREVTQISLTDSNFDTQRRRLNGRGN